MSDALTFAELNAQQVELLPARTVMSMFQLGSTGGSGTGGAGTGGAGGDADGGIGVNALNFNVGSGNQYNSAGDAYGGPVGPGPGALVPEAPATSTAWAPRPVGPGPAVPGSAAMAAMP